MAKTSTHVTLDCNEVSRIVENHARELVGNSKTLGTCKVAPVIDCGDKPGDQPALVGFTVEFLWVKNG